MIDDRFTAEVWEDNDVMLYIADDDIYVCWSVGEVESHYGECFYPIEYKEKLKLWELENVQADGRLIELPCKIGAKVYRIIECMSICLSHGLSCDYDDSLCCDICDKYDSNECDSVLETIVLEKELKSIDDILALDLSTIDKEWTFSKHKAEQALEEFMTSV